MRQLGISLEVDTYVPDQCLRELRKYFTHDSVDVPSIEQTFCDHQSIPWEGYNQFIRPLLVERHYRLGRAIELFPIVAGAPREFNSYRAQHHECREHELLVKAARFQAVKHLQFQPVFRQRAAQILTDVAKAKGLPINQITFIGVHNRRTDHLKYFQTHFHQGPLKPSYFHDAMDIFREDYDHPAFIFVSDDMKWAQAKIKNPHHDIFFVGNGDPDEELAIGTDLALLAACNATILSRGTFSIWAAILSGGEYYTEFGTIVPEHQMHPEDDFYHEELKFA
eukprot:maker-scaffold417_size177606-snap-gene-0.46 protein:Tk07597 transcript:maker-scaffold417_size177606-snap-gene-0.46-mRNA-1 annotation:"galactoside 2-alpha-l-fucosyltransferase 2"